MEGQRPDSDSEGGAAGAAQQTTNRTSVGELVRQLNDVPGQLVDGRDKRGRSESGDTLPAGKRSSCLRELGRSPKPNSETVKERVEVMLQDFETRILSGISKDIHELRDVIQSQLDSYEARIKDLERYAEDLGNDVESLKRNLNEAKEEIVRLHNRTEDAEINSRLPCLILSGDAVAPRRDSGGSGSACPVSGPGRASVDGGPPSGDRSRSDGAGRRQAAGGSAGGDSVGGGSAGRSPAAPAAGPGGGRRAGGGDGGEREDVHRLVVRTLNQCMPGLNMNEDDIDRAHRLPGKGNRIIVRFVRSGRGSVRDEVYWRRLSLRGRDLFVAESLTKLRGRIFRSLLSAKKEGKIHTVFTRGGHVLYKLREYGTAERVDSIQKVMELGFTVAQ